MSGSQVIVVDDVAHDDERLVAKVREVIGEEVLLDENETVGKDLEQVDSSVCAVLVTKRCAWGAVRVTGIGTPKETPNIVTSPHEQPGYVIVVIRAGQTCRLFKNPTVRYFRRKST